MSRGDGRSANTAAGTENSMLRNGEESSSLIASGPRPFPPLIGIGGLDLVSCSRSTSRASSSDSSSSACWPCIDARTAQVLLRTAATSPSLTVTFFRPSSFSYARFPALRHRCRIFSSAQQMMEGVREEVQSPVTC